MKILNSLVIGLALCSTGGCRSATPPPRSYGVREMWVGDSIRAASLNQAIVTQSALYPYHFIHGSAALNELGERDLAVLVDHFVKYPGSVKLIQGDANSDLYAARLVTVTEALEAAGIAPDDIEVSGGYPGGPGMSSERAITILEAERAAGIISLTGAGLVGTENQ